MLSRSFEIIITTYNRAEKVNELVSQLLNIVEDNAKIIVVDSSDTINTRLQQRSEICYLRSSHKNQPYQRYLGFLASQAEILIFLDDDMEIVEKNFVSKIEKLFYNNRISGVAIKFINKNEVTSLSKIPTSKLFRRHDAITEIKGWITGYPKLKPGKLGLCGNRGHQPVGGGLTEWVSGGAFAVRRVAIFNNFNFQLFDLFEEKLGMGEDIIIGYGISKQGDLLYFDELLFLHDDPLNSTYSNNYESFAERVTFSRLYLSLEKSRLDKTCNIFARVHYHYYALCRVIGLIINNILDYNKIRILILRGTCRGWRKSVYFRFDRKLTRSYYWHYEACKDLENNSILVCKTKPSSNAIN